MPHQVGGEWTDLKLEVMAAYFAAYARALKNQPFRFWYVDAFAGTGERVDSKGQAERAPSLFFGEEAKAVSDAKEGSVARALRIDPPFHRYLFIDRSKDHIERLRALCETYPNRSIDVAPGDANEELARLCSATDWRSTRAAVFVDPYGMQVSWRTLERLAATNAMDIALLFPTGSLNRMLTRDGKIPVEWERRIDDHLGPCNWRNAFYRKAVRQDLFDSSTITEKNIDLAGLEDFVKERLREIFPYVHDEAVPLKNSKGSVLYELFIICANPSPKAKSLAKKLAAGAIKAARKRRV